MVKQSRYSYVDTISRLSKAITDAGSAIFTTIDQAKAASAAGLQLRPTTLIIFGNPKGGTPLMDAFPLFALELPLKLLVWDDGTRVNVAYASMAERAHAYGVTGNEAIIGAMDHALDTLSGTVA